MRDVSEQGKKPSRQPVVSREGVIRGQLRGKLFLEGTWRRADAQQMYADKFAWALE